MARAGRRPSRSFQPTPTCTLSTLRPARRRSLGADPDLLDETKSEGDARENRSNS